MVDHKISRVTICHLTKTNIPMIIYFLIVIFDLHVQSTQEYILKRQFNDDQLMYLLVIFI